MTNKLAIIGGSGLYDVEEFKERELADEESAEYWSPSKFQGKHNSASGSIAAAQRTAEY